MSQKAIPILYVSFIFCILDFSVSTGFIQASMSKIQGLFKDF